MDRSEMQRDSERPDDQGTSSAVRIYSVVLIVGICCSLAIVSTYAWTRPIIARNRIAQRDRAIAGLLPTATKIVALEYLAESGKFETARSDGADAEIVFAAFDAADQWVGVAIETSGMGYQDTIRLLCAYDPNRQAVTGIQVLESRETPGLGDRIETDQSFLANFVHLDVAVSRGSDSLAHPIKFVPPGAKTSPWQIDGITGATISSRAVAEMLAASTARWIPRIQSRRDDFNVAGASR